MSLNIIRLTTIYTLATCVYWTEHINSNPYSQSVVYSFNPFYFNLLTIKIIPKISYQIKTIKCQKTRLKLHLSAFT